MEFNLVPIRLTDFEAIRLVRARAKKETRSAANALAVTVREALMAEYHTRSDTDNQQKKDKEGAT